MPRPRTPAPRPDQHLPAAPTTWSSSAGSVILRPGDRPRLEAAGEVDAALVDPAVIAAVAAASPLGADVDLSRVTFLDARGLRLVLTALDGPGDGGRVLGVVPPAVRTVADAVEVPLTTAAAPAER
ncbi:hypothetical protein [Cellulomonas sp. B6]|uniref:hypothetical protein n=1 Tax=Cellulomonas sp. B6 TaxID=1295626 RepID=UPI00073B2B79|nr:hypothetical protein [Cellulomonas sp. B6]KSW17831.1 hypothetical protein ATM99_17900 [Cellulomonas sp. B6]